MDMNRLDMRRVDVKYPVYQHQRVELKRKNRKMQARTGSALRMPMPDRFQIRDDVRPASKPR